MQTSNWSRAVFGADDQNMRVSDADRQAVADRLAAHYADGRLDQAEFDERVGRAMSAKTRADLSGLFDDLPEPPEMRGAGPAGAPGIPSGAAMVRKHGHGHPLVAAAVIVFIVIAIAHALWFLTSWVWIGIIALIVLAATGHLGHHHHHGPHHHGGPHHTDE
jgi:hypothetical protein